jgi:upstream activation factor subunit UAF30
MESAKVSKKSAKSVAAVATPAATPPATPAATPAVATAAKKASKVVEPAQVEVATPAPVASATPASATPASATPASATQASATQAPTPRKKAVKTVEAQSVAASTTGEATTGEATTGDATAVDQVDAHEDLEKLANEMIRMAKRLLEASRQAKKDYNRQVKKAEQTGKRRSRRGADGESTHSNSVFLQPAKISAELASFCGVAADSLLSRTEATRKIAAYIKEHDLQNPENRREIRADATLTKLFTLGAEDKLNYFNLQRYIKPHFIKE